MKILKGDKWLVATRGSSALEVEVLADVLTHEDQHVPVRILKGVRTYLTRPDDGPGDLASIRTTLTTWRKELK